MEATWSELNENLIQAIRTEGRETFGTGRLRTRWKRCHEIAGRAISAAPAGTILVQGIEQNREHSWLELPDGKLWDPVTCEFGTLHPQSVTARFNLTQVRRKLLETGFYDWWS